MRDAMIIFNGISLVVWFVCDIVDLTDRNSSHISYFIVWIVLWINLVCNMVASL